MAPETTTRTRPGRLLGDVIVSLGFCDRETVEDVVRDARAAGPRPGRALRGHDALVVTRPPAGEIRRVAIEHGMRPLIEDGLAKVRAGETTLAEIARVAA
jgi:hypothetical protein